ncbi:lipopolysaccharide biosynthesis protein [Maribacter sp. IgM3_T14_3]|uniref:lipopolysaccharide biosynthesis protein n=1 Tax=Maribacter sp. IgM3_T14_3 TaxID=3415140 RepID=UPI003C6F4EFB
MPIKINEFYKRLVGSSTRTQNIVKHIGWSTLFKGGSILANFLLVPISIDYLGQENYGVWLTLSSFIGWFTVLDIGLGHGLRNRFAEAKANGEIHLAKVYVSIAYITMSVICVGVIILFIFGNFLIDWSTIFNTSKILGRELSFLMPILFTFFTLQLVAKLILTIYTADQLPSIQGKIEFFIQALLLLGIWLLTKTSGNSLMIFGALYTGLPIILLISFNFIAFNGRYKQFKPEFKDWRYDKLKDITSLGFIFFIIQVANIVLLTTDNLIITNIFGPEEVVPYNIALKYFSILLMIHSLITTPYWSSFTEAYILKDFDWIKKSVKNIQKIWLSLTVILVLMLFLSNWFYVLWIGDSINIPLSLSASMALYIDISTFQSIYFMLINATGKIRMQLIISLITLCINIPLSILFAKNLGLGLSGIILATCVSSLMSAIIGFIQYQKIINEKAKGVWFK